jgi:transposase
MDKIFDSESIDGLKVKNARGRKRIFDKSHENKILKIIQRNPNIAAKKLQKIIEKDLVIFVGIATVYRLIRTLGFSYITAGKNHYKQDKEAVYHFKKNLQNEIKPYEELWFFDEGRFGTHSKIGHSWFKTVIRTLIIVLISPQLFLIIYSCFF